MNNVLVIQETTSMLLPARMSAAGGWLAEGTSVE